MTVIMLERVQILVRGEVSRWMLEPKAGVFVGRVSAMVRDKLWEKVCDSTRGGAGMLIHNADTEQVFAVQLVGAGARTIVDMEGLYLVQIPDT